MTRSVKVSGVSRRRTAVEVALVAFVLALPLELVLRPALGPVPLPADAPAQASPWAGLALGLSYVGYVSALVGAIRLRRGAGSTWWQIALELAGGAIVVVAVWVGTLLAHTIGAAGAAPVETAVPFAGLPPAFAASTEAFIAATGAAMVYPICRSVAIVWSLWNRLRRTRLLWAITHAQLVGSLVLVAGGTVAFRITSEIGRSVPRLGPATLADDASTAARVLAWVTTVLLPTVTEMVFLAIMICAVLIPPAALITFLVLRQTTRRLEELAAAARAVRGGNLSTRVSVRGEDEVGRLQDDFNVMAADLERTLGDLEAERNRVAGLLEARRQLVASVSHELRTPIATVRGYLDAALRRDEAPPESPAADTKPGLQTDLETIDRELTRLQRLIDDLFALSRAEVGRLELRPEPTDVGALVCRLVETTAPLAWQQRRVEVIADVAPDLPAAHTDAERLEQIVSNLIANAIRHTPPGGLVAATVGAEPDAVRIEVRDTGEGIPTEDLPHIFERFYRGANASGERRDGAGLGLALAKELAEAMGGSIAATSAPGEGSCLTVRLPLAT